MGVQAAKKARFTESQILAILTEGGSGIPGAEACRKHSISNATYFQWKSKYAGVSLPELKRVKELEAENVRQKVLNAPLFDSLAQAQQILEVRHIEYNTLRSHEFLSKKTPKAFLARVVNDEISTFNLSTRRGSLGSNQSSLRRIPSGRDLLPARPFSSAPMVKAEIRR